MDFVASGGNAARAGADENPAVIAIQFRQGILTYLGKLLYVLNQPLPLNSSSNASAFSGVMEG